jgi:post-segregation antitoxin (ccd killing protein)
MYYLVYYLSVLTIKGVEMTKLSAKKNFNISIASDNADFVKRNGMNLSKAVDTLISEMRRIKAREDWSIKNQSALGERCKLLVSEGGTAAERLYGVLPSQET